MTNRYRKPRNDLSEELKVCPATRSRSVESVETDWPPKYHGRRRRVKRELPFSKSRSRRNLL